MVSCKGKKKYIKAQRKHQAAQNEAYQNKKHKKS
jgi:hypothetical protein